jgi:hypothetical protein
VGFYWSAEISDVTSVMVFSTSLVHGYIHLCLAGSVALNGCSEQALIGLLLFPLSLYFVQLIYCLIINEWIVRQVSPHSVPHSLHN